MWKTTDDRKILVQLLRRWWLHLIGDEVSFRRKAVIHGSSVVVKLIISYGQEDALQAAGNCAMLYRC